MAAAVFLLCSARGHAADAPWLVEPDASEEWTPRGPLQDADERPWRLPPDLLERLESKAVQSERLALRFTCHETVERTRYRRGSSDAREAIGSEYLLILGREGELEEHRSIASRSRFARHRTEPVPYEWGLLFSPKLQPYFAYRHLGEGADGFSRVARIGFRGAIPFRRGRDIREWEGVATVEADTGALVEIVAMPLNQTERLSAMRREFMRRLKVSIGVVGAPPLLVARPGKNLTGRRITLQFEPTSAGPSLPAHVRYDVVKVASAGLEPLETVHKSYLVYRFFETTTLPGPYEVR